MTSMEDVADRTMTSTEEGASSAERHESDTNFNPAQSVLSKFDSLLTLTYGTEMEEKARDELLRRILDVKRSTFSAFKAQNEYASSLERSVELQKMHVRSSRDELIREEKVIGRIKKEIADIGAAKKYLETRIRGFDLNLNLTETVEEVFGASASASSDPVSACAFPEDSREENLIDLRSPEGVRGRSSDDSTSFDRSVLGVLDADATTRAKEIFSIHDDREEEEPQAQLAQPQQQQQQHEFVSTTIASLASSSFSSKVY